MIRRKTKTLREGQRVRCMWCNALFKPPHRARLRWQCPECNRRTWNRKVSVPDLHKIAWPLFARLVKFRARDEDGLCTCVSCGKRLPWDDPYLHAGHFRSRSHKATLYLVANVHPQCSVCNSPQLRFGGLKYGPVNRDDVVLNYQQWLRENVGPDEPDRLIQLSRQLRQWTRHEVAELIEELEEETRREGLA